MPLIRTHHYHFTHEAVPDLAFREKAHFLDSARTQGDVFLEHFWVLVGEDLSPSERMKRVDLHHKVKERGAFRAVLTIVPPADAAGEAYFTVFVGEHKAGLFGSGLKNFRYFLLERMDDHRGQIRTQFVEIDQKLKRYELGRGCPPDSEDFWKMVVRYMTTGHVPPSSMHLGIK